MNKKLISFLGGLIIIIGILLFFLSSENICGDGTLNRACSDNQPFYCEKNVLVENSSFCGCPENFTLQNETCYSEYFINPKKVSLNYVLDGKEGIIDFVIYGGVADYLQNVSKSIVYYSGQTPSREDFKERTINNEIQTQALLGLVKKIQNLDSDPENQARIAISLVQNIPYNQTAETYALQGREELIYSRYPYEVLYDTQGICGERSELLVFLLKEIGFGTSLFYYPSEIHEAVGIKCLDEYSLNNTGYCFIETTGPAIISDSENYYLDWGELSSDFEMIVTSEGIALGDIDEYKDADKRKEIYDLIQENGQITRLQKIQWENLKEKYGLNL